MRQRRQEEPTVMRNRPLCVDGFLELGYPPGQVDKDSKEEIERPGFGALREKLFQHGVGPPHCGGSAYADRVQCAVSNPE